MTRELALETLRRLAGGLSVDNGCMRFLERISQHDERELLQALLVEAGARAVLEETAG